MSIEVTAFDDEDAWNEHVERSSVGTLFHRHELLEVAERHSSARLYPLIGHKGQEPVGLFPAFEIRKGGVSTVFSPPPGLAIPFQGPVPLNDGKLRRRKAERRNRRFVEGCLEWLEDRVSPRYVRICTPVGYEDPRPFTWNEYDISPLHTYRLAIDEEPESLKGSFSKSLRRYLDPDEEDRFVIEERGEDAIRFVHEQVRARYEAQGKTYAVPLEYLLELYETLPMGAIRPYVAEIDGDLASGIVSLEDESTIYFSEGGGKPDVEYPLNDLLHWEIIQDARARGIDTYDLCGANTPRICKYKSKFNPELCTYYEAEKGTLLLNTVANLYRKYR